MSVSKEEYLKRYLGGPSSNAAQPKKKKKKAAVPVKPTNVMVFDHDLKVEPKKAVVLEEEEEDAPIVVNKVEEKAPRGYYDRGTDGSGWTVVKAPEDQSPPRRKKGAAEEDQSPPRRNKPADDDQSPPRRRQAANDDQSPPRRRRHDSRSPSPPRRNKDSDLSPKRRSRHDSPSPPRRKMPDTDISPPRRKNTQSDDISPPRRGRSDDLSPPRKSRQQDSSPPRRPKDSDLSPPRKKIKSEPDSSPPRRRRHDSASPPRKRHDSPRRDSSPPRRRHDSPEKDLSPPRKRHDSPPAVAAPSATHGKMVMSDGVKAGLLSKEEFMEADRRKRAQRDAIFDKADPEMLGKGAATVFRDKKGKKLSINEIIEQQERGKKGEEEGMEWGKGLVQKQQKEDLQARMEAEKYKPFARSIEDSDLNDMYKETDRWGDPMAGMAKSDKKSKKGKKEKKRKEVKRLWNCAAPPNRFNIMPGPFWDGVDRSSGFENKLLSRSANEVALQEQRYLDEVEDM
eukprot:TRINITY_DN1994_c0_g1_i1.p1 TRINITY_DN1994_c0_g1~~TRINITY_DN1994_c0_g1_i1.p1  ORF type:complete len:509 (-),score=148.52 TRINITY_DN1994_c0_g1_i1:25-1551(-)